MNVQAFWNVIGMYNRRTIVMQIILLIIIVIALILSYGKKKNWISKAVLGIANLFVEIVFFGIYGVYLVYKEYKKA